MGNGPKCRTVTSPELGGSHLDAPEHLAGTRFFRRVLSSEEREGYCSDYVWLSKGPNFQGNSKYLHRFSGLFRLGTERFPGGPGLVDPGLVMRM